MNARQPLSSDKVGDKLLNTVFSAKPGTIITLPPILILMRACLVISKDLQLVGGPGCILAFPEEIIDFSPNSIIIRVEREFGSKNKIRFSAS